MDMTTRVFTAIFTIVFLGMASSSAKVRQVSMYMFGYAASFRDSTAYITSIQRLDTVTIDQKTKFLKDRNLYSYQLQQHIAQAFGQEDALTAVFYDTKQAKLEKKAASIIEKSGKSNGLRLKTLDFRFHTEEWIEPEVVEAKEEATATHNKKKHKAKRSR